MTLEINGKDYMLHFGMAFLRALDKKYTVKTNNAQSFGFGIESTVPLLLAKDPKALAELIYEGCCTEEKRPKLADIDAYIDECDDLDALFDEVIDELKKSNATKTKVIELAEDFMKQQAKLKETIKNG